jgi:hypothetical protein
MLRIPIAVLMLLHGIAHLPGVVGSWRLAELRDVPYHTTLLAGRMDVGDGGMRLVGGLWLLAALGFVGSAVTALRDDPWWVGVAAVVTMLSLALCALEWPYTRIGVPVNLAIVLALLLGRALHRI